MKPNLQTRGGFEKTYWLVVEKGNPIEGILVRAFETSIGPAYAIRVTEPCKVREKAPQGSDKEMPVIEAQKGDLVAFICPTAGRRGMEECAADMTNVNEVYVRVQVGDLRPSPKNPRQTFRAVKVESALLAKGATKFPVRAPAENPDADDDIPF